MLRAILTVLFLGTTLVRAGAADPADLDLAVSLEPAAHRIGGTARLLLRDMGAGEPAFELHPGLEVLEVLVDGEPAPFEVAKPEKPPGKALLTVTLPERKPGEHRYAVRYAGEIHDPPSVAEFSRERIADQTQGTVQSEGVFLSPASCWYPRVHELPLGTFRAEIRLPSGWSAVSEGSLESREEGHEGTCTVFRGKLPPDGLDLVAGRYQRFEEVRGDVVVAAYLYPEDADLAKPYLAAVGRYLDLYSAWIGPYAYGRFTVVENFFPTGYGMPGFTLLGREVMRLPFIVATSLGHEVAHNWWGNGVFVDEEGGNWCEGLATYVADYHYKEMESAEAAAEYRREMARDYTNYVSEPGRDMPLSEFTERSTPATRSIGYGKSMMLFHMLERRLGKERFDAALRSVYRENLGRRVSWRTWRTAFSKVAGEDLGWFFDQWVPRPGAPRLAVEQATVRRRPPAREPPAVPTWEVSGELAERDGVWRIRVPLVFEGGGRTERRSVEAEGARTRFAFELPFRPESLRVDPGQDVFRRLDTLEMPPVLSRLLGDPGILVVVDDTGGEALAAAYRDMAAVLTRTGEGQVVDASRATSGDLVGRSVLLLGVPEGEAFRGLLSGLPRETTASRSGFSVRGTEFREPGAALLAVGRHPGDAAKAVGLFLGLTPGAVNAAGRKLVHYGKYSFLAFVDGTNRVKGVAEVTGGPLVVRFPPE